MASALIFAFSSSKQNIENVLLVIMPELNVDLVQLRPPETKKKKKNKINIMLISLHLNNMDMIALL